MPLRTPQKSDAASVAALSIEVWLGTYLKKGVSAFFAEYVLKEFTIGNTEALMSDPSHFLLVSDNIAGIDGFIRVATNSQAPVSCCSDMEISTLYVRPRHHGKGIGKRLLQAAVERCRERGATSVWLTTNAENIPAIKFYLSQGFEHVGETHFRIDAETYLNNVYRCKLE